jgi:HlyD family secretion protein
MRKILLALVLVVACAGAGGWYFYQGNNRPASFRTTRAERGDLVAMVSASGTIEPEEVVDVGAQVAGQILTFGDDPRGSGRVINFGSPVEQGTVLARIDESLYRTQVDRAKAMVEQAQAALESSEAQVAQAEANVQRAEADLGQMQAKLYQSDRDLARARRLRPTGAVADVDYDTTEATFRTNKSSLAVGEATIAQNKAGLKNAVANVAKSKAALADAKASLANAETNLGYCTIRSPVKGVIVDRRVNIGQTVVSSLNAPSLFLIAKDLKRLQVWASVNEADIGNIYSGQPVTFTVDAYPGRQFKGVVAPDQPRLNASMTQNVVTYTVVVTTDNSDGKLLPYLTANLQFEVSRRHDVLLVPNSALRWKPNPRLVAPDARSEYVQSQRRAKGNAGDHPAGPAEKERHDQGRLWVEDGDGFVRPVKVTIGPSDGVMTEVVAGEIHEGDAVVLGESRSGGDGGSTNPFAPKMFGGGGKKE